MACGTKLLIHSRTLTVKVWEWISSFIQYVAGDVIAYPCWDISQSALVEVSPDVITSIWWCHELYPSPGGYHLTARLLHSLSLVSVGLSVGYGTYGLQLAAITFLAATKQLYEWFSPSVRLSACLSVCLSVRHTFLTMFPSSYHHEIFRSCHHGLG